MGCDQNIYPEIELFVPNKKWVMDVPLHNVGFNLVVCLRPLWNISDSIEEKDAFPLTFSNLFKKKITGFMIQTALLLRLNSSRKIGY